jgi:hypothetical protein
LKLKRKLLPVIFRIILKLPQALDVSKPLKISFPVGRASEVCDEIEATVGDLPQFSARSDFKTSQKSFQITIKPFLLDGSDILSSPYIKTINDTSSDKNIYCETSRRISMANSTTDAPASEKQTDCPRRKLIFSYRSTNKQSPVSIVTCELKFYTNLTVT